MKHYCWKTLTNIIIKIINNPYYTDQLKSLRSKTKISAVYCQNIDIMNKLINLLSHTSNVTEE